MISNTPGKLEHPEAETFVKSIVNLARRSAAVTKVNSTYRSVKSDRVNLVAPASPVHRAGQTVLTPAVCLPV